MKKLIVATILLVSGITLHAQIALRGGLNYSNVSINGTNIETDSKVGFHAGLQGHIDIGSILAVRPALLYNIKGAKVDNAGASESRSLHYIELPANLAFRFGGDDLAVILEGGPYFGYLVNTSDGLFNDIGKTDWGANFGAVVELSSLGIGLNYSNGLSDIEAGERLGQAFRVSNGNLAAFIYLKF